MRYAVKAHDSAVPPTKVEERATTEVGTRCAAKGSETIVPSANARARAPAGAGADVDTGQTFFKIV